MDISSFFKKFCIVFLLPLLFACGGGDVDTYLEPNISVFPPSCDFGGIVVDNSSDKTFTITNSGTKSLTIGTILPPIDPFFILADTCSNKSLAVNETCSVSVRFSPIDQDIFPDTVSIPSNDPDGTVTIDLSGEGYGLNVWISRIDTVGCEVTVDVNVTSPLIADPINTLTANNFELYENGQAIPIIDSVENHVPSPVSVVLAIDWSNSLIEVIDTIQAAAIAFVDSLNAGTDEAGACKFHSDIESDPVAPGFYTGDYSELKTYINDDFPVASGTRLYDAVYDSITRAAASEEIENKKAVVVLSDGVNSTSAPDPGHTLAEVIAHAIEEEIPVFTIYYRDPDYQGGGFGNPEIMKQLAEDTGGKYYDGTAVVDLADVYDQISNILTSKYTITYTSPTNCTGIVPLEVLVDYTDPVKGPLHGEDSGTIVF